MRTHVEPLCPSFEKNRIIISNLFGRLWNKTPDHISLYTSRLELYNQHNMLTIAGFLLINHKEGRLGSSNLGHQQSLMLERK